MFSSFHHRLTDWAFYSGLLLVIFCFLWTRIDTSDHLYFVGDGTVIVAMIEEMLKSGNWTADVGRIAHTLQVQAEWQPYAEDVPQAGSHYFNLSGYVVVATAFCKGLQILGFDALSTPYMLHGFNVLLQGVTLWLLFWIGKLMVGRTMGLLIIFFFTLLPLAVTEAHYERPESWLAFLSALILLALLTYSKAPKRSALIIGSALGFSVAVKFSQFFLGIIPFLLLCHLFWNSSKESGRLRLRSLLVGGVIMAGGMIAALAINVPFVFSHLADYFHEVSTTSGFFDVPHPLYAIEHYRYISQLLYISNYFLSTLGIVWCLILLWGLQACLSPSASDLQMAWYYRLSLVIPPLFILFFFSLKYNFMERVFSSTEPMLCIVSAIGVRSIYVLSKKSFSRQWLLNASMFFLLALVLYKPIELNYKFVQHYVRQPGYQPRIEFQDLLKKDFHGFWIKNLHMTLGFSGELPEKPEKAPRIYHVEDFNQYWNSHYLEKLQKHHFVLIATYCSDFYEMPSSNYTIYHAPAKNHYLVRQDEWPDTVQLGYFKTNCP